MADVYISYARGEANIARELAERIRGMGLSAWLDEELRAGESFADAMATQLSGAKAVIVLWSAEAARSVWSLREAREAINKSKYVGLFGPGFDPSIAGVGFRNVIGGRVNLYWPQDSNWSVIEEYLKLAFKHLGLEASTNVAMRQGTAPSRGFAFLSHVEEDVPIVSKISEFLKTRNYAYWTYHESDRDYQKPTVLEIEECMNECALMLTIISPDWKRSEWTQREPAFAREIRKPLFHLRFRHPGPTLAIAGDTYFDFERGEGDAFRRLGLELDKKGL